MIPLNTVKKSRIDIFLNNLMLTSPVTSNTFLLWYFDFTSGFHINSVDTERKLNVHKMFRRRSGRLLNVLCTFNLRPVSMGNINHCKNESFTYDLVLLKNIKAHIFNVNLSLICVWPVFKIIETRTKRR